ncbi:MAG: TatD DNase family protein [Candidatus Saganbacteria bacterium]|uniref:TatD DNase family protein n=1 Tax=Candidatus Saganbacteria bacterium TaxID=2575572 RepID=A0A833KZS3_UNCSA|nr:MAG: TatD DNase family protein [Candidatus Saganbacteria bacterium]
MYIDTHAHLTMPEYDDLAEVISRAKQSGIENIINASFDIESSKKSVQLAEKNDFIYAAVGIHPHDADKVDEKTILEIKNLVKHVKVVAIGETGLDYFYNKSSKEAQKSAFRKFLSLAQEINKPVIIHCRDAQSDVISIMREENKGTLRGVFHCFAGDYELIKFALEIDFYISYTGIATFKKAQNIKENILKTPIENLLLETDCPYLAPEPFRGKRNEPAYVKYIAEAIAQIKGLPVEEIAQKTTANARKLFKI